LSAGLRERRGVASQWLGAAVFALDSRLQRAQGIFEYSTDPGCFFRIQRTEADQSVAFPDGTRLNVGDPILDLHIWNEHMPPIGRQGPTLSWGRQFSQAIDRSLRALADYLRQNPDLDHIIAIRADMRLRPAERGDQLAKIVGHFGFHRVPGGAASRRLRRLGEHILMFLLVVASNPYAAWATVFRRDCTVAYLSRRVLERRYPDVPDREPAGKRSHAAG
jgi:YkoP domain